MKKYVRRFSSFFSFKIARYLLSGSIVTFFCITLLYVFVHVFHIHYLLSSSIIFVIGLFISFLIHKYWTFQSKQEKHSKQFVGHAALAGWNFLLNAGLMFLFVGKIELFPVVGQVITSGLIAIQSFFIYSNKIFNA